MSQSSLITPRFFRKAQLQALINQLCVLKHKLKFEDEIRWKFSNMDKAENKRWKTVPITREAIERLPPFENGSAEAERRREGRVKGRNRRCKRKRWWWKGRDGATLVWHRVRYLPSQDGCQPERWNIFTLTNDEQIPAISQALTLQHQRQSRKLLLHGGRNRSSPGIIGLEQR